MDKSAIRQCCRLLILYKRHSVTSQAKGNWAMLDMAKNKNSRCPPKLADILEMLYTRCSSTKCMVFSRSFGTLLTSVTDQPVKKKERRC